MSKSERSLFMNSEFLVFSLSYSGGEGWGEEVL